MHTLIRSIRKLAAQAAYPSFQECGPIELLILQATPFCNIDCSYCYLRHRADATRMQESVLEATLSRVKESGLITRPFTIAWHAGEPLAAGPKFYERAFELIAANFPDRALYTLSIQTNATLINSTWIDLFLRHNVKVGVSIDGPQSVNDAHRIDRRGNGTFEKTVSGIRKLRKAGLPFHTISVISRNSLGQARAIYRFLSELGSSYICFNIEEIEARNTESSLNGDSPESNSRDLARRFMEDIFDCCTAADAHVRVREIDGALSAMQSWNGNMRFVVSSDYQQVHPFKIISVAHNGDFSTFCPELLGEEIGSYGRFVLGNVLSASIRDAYESQLLQDAYRSIQRGVDRCREECGYFQFCGGGVPANKIFENGSFDSSETMFCALHRKATLDAVLGRLEAIKSVSSR